MGLAGQAMTGNRAGITLTYRLASRLFQACSPLGGARSRRWRGVLVASVAADLGLAAYLRRPGSPSTAIRTGIDAVDGFIWGFSPARSADAAVLTDVPLLTDLTYGGGLRAVVGPMACTLTGVTAGRVASGRRPSASPLVWQLLGVAAGGGLRREELRHERRLDVLHRRRLEAQRTRARLAGQSDVAIGADTVADLLIRTIPLIGSPRADSVLLELASAWKASLAEAAGQTAAYLGSVLLGWSRATNQHPELDGVVSFAVEAGAGTVLLTPAQARSLTDRLDALALSGPVAVGIAPGGRARLPGDAITLTIGDWDVTLPADRGEPVRPVDPGPMALVLAAVISCNTATPAYGGAPVWSVAVPAAATLAVGRSVAARLAADPESKAATWAALVFAAVHTELMGHVLHRHRDLADDEHRVYPMLGALTGIAGISQFNWHRLSPWDRTLLVTGVLAILVRGWRLVPPPRSFAAALADGSWIVSAAINGRILQARLEAAAQDTADVLGAESAVATAAAYQDGRRFVTAFLRRAVDEARAQLDADAGAGAGVMDDDPRIATEARRRLDEAEWRLDQIAGGLPTEVRSA